GRNDGHQPHDARPPHLLGMAMSVRDVPDARAELHGRVADVLDHDRVHPEEIILLWIRLLLCVGRSDTDTDAAGNGFVHCEGTLTIGQCGQYSHTRTRTNSVNMMQRAPQMRMNDRGAALIASAGVS